MDRNSIPDWLISAQDLYFYLTFPTIEVLDAVRHNTDGFPKRMFSRESQAEWACIFLFSELFEWEGYRYAHI